MIYVSQKTANKSRGIVATWYNPSCMLFISSKTHLVDKAVAIDYNGDDYPHSVTAKAVLGLQVLWDTFPNRSYYGVCGDDTLVDIPRLLHILVQMHISSDAPYLLGQAMTELEYRAGTKRPTRVFGGAPIILTKKSIQWHNHITRANPSIWTRSRLPHDLWIGQLFMRYHPSVRIVHVPHLYSQPPWFYRPYPNEREGGITKMSISFHYLDERTMYWIWPLWKSRRQSCELTVSNVNDAKGR